MQETGSLERITDHLIAGARDYPDRPALLCGGSSLTYIEYEERVREFARALASQGLGAGNRIALLMDNITEHPVAFLAAERLGITSVLINNRLSPQEVDFILGDSKPRLMVVGERFVTGDAGAQMRDVLGARFDSGAVVVAGRPPEGGSFVPFKTFMEAAGGVSGAELERLAGIPGPDTPVSVIYTSGTTGHPKGAVLTERNIVFNLTAWRERLPENDPGEVVVGVFFPLFHSGGMVGGICGCVINGFTVVLADFDIEGSLRLISEHRVKVMGAVAAMAALQLAHPLFDDYDYSSLDYIIMGAGPCPPEILREVKRRMGADVIIGYGLTEGTMGNLITTLKDDTEEHKLHTIGIPLPGVEVRLVDAERRDVPDGTVGEIAIGGPTVFAGYLDNPGATARAKDEQGWLFTGDLAVRSSDGYYRIAGRTSEMYIRGGENVYPKEIEEVLQKHPDVLLAAVLGIPDDVMGESGRAYVLRAPGSILTEDEVKAYCAANLADYKVPKEVVFREMLPLTPVGKVLKKVLAEEIKSEFGLAGGQ